MKNFKQYLKEAEIAATKRKGILHLEKAKPSEFLELARDIMRSNNGKLQDVKISLKVDGAGIRFGKDSQGRFFFETSHSGPIQQRKAFSSHVLQNGGNLTRAIHYDNMYDHLEASNLWKDLPKDTKVVAEILYNPMAEVIQDKLKFVTVSYDKSKLGSLMTIIPLNVLVSSTGKEHRDKENIIKELLKKSTSKIKIETADLQNSTLDVKAILKPLFVLDSDIDTVLTSRKASDKAKKELYLTIIQSVKDQLAKFILEHPGIRGKDKFGQEIEGLVLDIGNRQFKVTTDTFKASKQVK